MPTNTLYIMTGLPYSGKTTLTKELIKRFGFEVVSVDDIMDADNMWRKGHPTQEDWDKAYSKAYDDIKKYLILNKSIIFDCANLPFHERETPRLIAKSFGVSSKVIFLKISKEEILERRGNNAKTKERDQLDKKQMERAFELFDEPRAEEEVIIYNQKLNLEEWVKKNIKL